MELLDSMVRIWLVHAAIATVLSAPIVFFGRKRVDWQWWELSALVLPFTVWSLLLFSDLSIDRKTLANLGEPVCFSLAIPLAALARVALGTRVGQRVCAGCLISALCVTAAGVFFFVPPLPECCP